MNIALSGYGRMGKSIESIVKSMPAHQICLVITRDNFEQLTKADFDNIDVIIDFSTPKSAVTALTKYAEFNIPTVSGTTGWLEDYQQVCNCFTKSDGAFLYAANFSIGMNFFFAINKYATSLLKNQDYNVHIEEDHHIHKLDKPSGTAIHLANDITALHEEYDGWTLDANPQNKRLSIHAKREAEIKGNHRLVFSNALDKITLSHEALDRTAFSKGAVKAAEWIIGKQGIFDMSDVLDLKRLQNL